MTAQPAITSPQRAKLTARDFWLLADAGTFADFAKTELIEGEIWVVHSIWVWHARTVAYIIVELGLALREMRSDLVVYGSGSVDLSDYSVPEPDVAIGEPHEGKGLPATKLRLVIEVSDSTLDADLGRKAPLYARNGVPEYWVVDREGSRVVRMWEPTANGYARSDDTRVRPADQRRNHRRADDNRARALNAGAASPHRVSFLYASRVGRSAASPIRRRLSSS